MGFWNALKNIKSKIEEVETAVYSGRFSLYEVYERNAKLEAEIAERTRELETANLQMLTLQHIWDMMNSSKPLTNVLNAVVNSLQGELGYLHSCIVKKEHGINDDYFQLLAWCGEMFGESFTRYFKVDPSQLKLEVTKLKDNVSTDEIYHSTDVFGLIKEVLPQIPDRIIEKSLKKTNTQSYIFIPLYYKENFFGCLVVFSSRQDISDNELNFLQLFAKQIELAITIAGLFEEVKAQAVTDGMTGLYNRRYFEDFIKNEVMRAKRQNQKFTVIGLDLDHLKQINDVYGHSYGDLAIKSIAEVLKSSCRSIDIAARMGGEEFNIILPGIDSKGGMVVAERVRKAIEALKLEKIGHITASIGVGTFVEHSRDVEELLELVDQAMYESKKNGRNCTTLAKSSDDSTWKEIAINTFIQILEKHQLTLDDATSKHLNEKLSKLGTSNDLLFQTSDLLVSTYHPEHKDGTSKQKLMLASLLAKRFELSRERTDKLKMAILLYDIGNILLPKEILNKKTPLTEEELTSIKQHPIIAARKILEPISNVVDIIPIIEKHHENWDGSGYPAKISGEDIPVESQIILIIDSFFALLEERPYRGAKTKQEALQIIIDGANSKWSEKLAKEFVQIVNNES